MIRSLRSATIRLAYVNPSLRRHLLPLLKAAAGSADATYMKALDNLADLADLTENAQEIIDGFNLHYAAARVAGRDQMDPQIASEFQVFNKVVEGGALAVKTVEALTNLVKLFPEETKYAKALADATKMREKLGKQVEASRKILHTLSKKIAPKAIIALAKKVESKIESRLIDPSKIKTFFSQGQYSGGEAYSNFVVQVFVPLPNPDSDQLGAMREHRLWLQEDAVGSSGVTMNISWDSRIPYGNWKPATVDGALDLFLEATEGWNNVKGEAEGQSARKNTAYSIAQAINNATSRLGGGRDAVIKSDFRTVTGEYRSSLPKEGAYSVGEYRYEEMVSEEIARFKKILDPALAPFKSQIKNISFEDSEKSWIHVTVWIK